MGSDDAQKIDIKIVDKLKRYGFYEGKNSSFQRAIERLLSFYEENQKIYEKWKKKRESKE